MQSASLKVLRAGQVVVWASLFAGGAQLLAQDNRGSVVLVLKDPTPREPDLDLLYKPSTPESSPTAAKVSAFNQRRLQLITRASEHIASLSAVLHSSMSGVRDGTSLAPQAQVAAAIEVLAGNIYAALVTHPPASTAPAQKASAPESLDRNKLKADTAELATLSEQLKLDVSKSDPDVLPVGVIVQSAKVRDLAHSLKERMQHP